MGHNVANRKGAGYVPNDFTDFFFSIDRKLPGGLCPWGRLNLFTAICEPIVLKMWEPRRLTTLWASTACYTDSFTFFFAA
jgi:hypothetical protein